MKKYTTILQLMTGVFLISIVNELNKNDVISWATVVVAFLGVVNVVVAVFELLGHKSNK